MKCLLPKPIFTIYVKCFFHITVAQFSQFCTYTYTLKCWSPHSAGWRCAHFNTNWSNLLKIKSNCRQYGVHGFHSFDRDFVLTQLPSGNKFTKAVFSLNFRLSWLVYDSCREEAKYIRNVYWLLCYFLVYFLINCAMWLSCSQFTLPVVWFSFCSLPISNNENFSIHR